jgi:aryl-alcohol dehydrogenase-like predicted oxidoreductase
MALRPLGATGLEVTPVGFGLAAVGRPGYITLGREHDLGADRSVEALERRSHEVLDAAYDAGIRYFDAARSYGYAERFLASWLRQRGLPPRTVTVGSKWGYTYVGDWRVDARVHEVKDHSLAALRRQIDESRELLGESLDLYQIHSATLESGVLEDRAVLAELNKLRADGLAIGLSVHSNRCRRPGTSSRPPPPRRSPRRTTPDGAWSSRRRWRTGGSPTAIKKRLPPHLPIPGRTSSSLAR